VARGPPRGSAVKPASSASPRSANPPAAAPTPRAGMPRDNVARTRFVDCLEVKEVVKDQESTVGKERWGRRAVSGRVRQDFRQRRCALTFSAACLRALFRRVWNRVRIQRVLGVWLGFGTRFRV
jgi:hypothetical protein